MSLTPLTGAQLVYECLECKNQFYKPLPRGWLSRKLLQWLPVHCSICHSDHVQLSGLLQS